MYLFLPNEWGIVNYFVFEAEKSKYAYCVPAYFILHNIYLALIKDQRI